MKNAQPHKDAELSAPNSLDFKASFPSRFNTVTAQVLQKLLAGESLTGMDAVFNASTTRLGAYIHALKRDYGWHCEHRDIAVSCKDGRVTEIRAYFFSRETNALASAMGTDDFCEKVIAARAKLRSEQVKAKAEAARRNQRRVFINTDPRQFLLGY
jgi:HJR/Mrr/RecB family endonuclease